MKDAKAYLKEKYLQERWAKYHYDNNENRCYLRVDHYDMERDAFISVVVIDIMEGSVAGICFTGRNGNTHDCLFGTRQVATIGEFLALIEPLMKQ